MPDAVFDTPPAPSVDAPPNLILPVDGKTPPPSPEISIAQNAEKERNDALAELAATRDQLKTEVASDLSSEEKFGLGSRVDAKRWNATVAANEADGRAPVGQTPTEVIQKPVAPKSRWKTILPGVLAFLKLAAPKGVDTVATPQDIQQELLRPQPIVREMTTQQIDQLKQMPEPTPQANLEPAPQSMNDVPQPTPESVTPGQPTGDVNPTGNTEPDNPVEKQPNEPVSDNGNPNEPEKPPSELIDMSQGERGTITVRPGDSGDLVPSDSGLRQNQLPSDPDTTTLPKPPGAGSGGARIVSEAEVEQQGADVGQIVTNTISPETPPK